MELDTTTKVPVEWLRLDRLNPRLLGTDENATDESVIARLYLAADLGELLQSIAANGYMDIEPLVVMGDLSAESGDLTVLEGNRRLAALRLLRESDLAQRIWASERVRIPIRPSPTHSELPSTKCQSIPSPIASGRGRSSASSTSKSGEVGCVRESPLCGRSGTRRGKPGYRPGGDRQCHWRQARHHNADGLRYLRAGSGKYEGLFDIEDRHTTKLNFSHLYTALSRSQYMDYLGLGAAWARHDPEPDQVPREKHDQLRKVLVWIYGSKKDKCGRSCIAESGHQASRGGDRPPARAPRARNEGEPRRGSRQHRTGGHGSLLRSFHAQDHIGEAARRSAPMTGAISRCSTSRKASRKPRRWCTNACERRGVKRVTWNDGLPLSSHR